MIPLSSILAVRSGRAEEMIQRILTGEGIVARAGIPYDLQLDSFPQLFRSFKAMGKNVIVELLPEDPRDDPARAFLIGKVVGMSGRSAAILHFNAVGQWSTEPSVVPYDQIKWITFDTEYINVFSKYLR